jgi:hypothetical protein
MWKAYTRSPESVVITTSAKALKQFLPREIMKFAVRYAPLDFPRTEFSHNSLFFYKPSEYHIEQEFRLLRSPEKDEVFDFSAPKDAFRKIPIRTRKIVHRVITHPQASDRTKTRVDDMLRTWLPGVRRCNSALEI